MAEARTEMASHDAGWVLPVRLTPPSLGDNTADLDRLAGDLAGRLGTSHVRTDLETARRLPAQLRHWGYAARCIVFQDQGQWLLAGVADPDESLPVAGVAVDLGTTRIVVALLDLLSGERLAEVSFDNPQLTTGPDILARIHHAEREGAAPQLQRQVVDGVDHAVRRLCREAALDPGRVFLLAVAGNTAMTHLFLGLESRWMIREPYIPAANRPEPVRAGTLGFAFHPSALVYAFPNAGSYFGGDVVAGILFSGLHRRETPALLVDVGTNAEVVCGCRSWMIACAGAAGPALEGGMSKIGMAAGPGAIDRIRIEPGSGRFDWRTIGGAPPKGICGSGMIDLAAQLFLSGLVDIRGRLVPSAGSGRLTEEKGVVQLTVVGAGEAGIPGDLRIGQPELDSLIRSKAAMYTILETLVQTVGLTFEDIARFYVAGTFGSVIDPVSAITIGMLPDLPPRTFRVIGNSSLGGACRVLTSRAAVGEVDAIRNAITYLELNVNQDFMNRFSAAKFLPHTDTARFPSVAARRREAGRDPAAEEP